MGKNAYLERQRAERRARDYLVEGWTAQLCTDLWAMVLNDPKVMGPKGRIGRKRYKRLAAAFNELYVEARNCLTNAPNSSHLRAQIEREMQRIGKEEYIPWEERYDNWDDRGI